MTTKESLKKLMEEMKPMTGKQRVDHVWTYYKDYLWVIAVAMILLMAIISSFFNLGKETVIKGMMVNIAMEQTGYNYLTEDYAPKVVTEKNQEVALEYTNFSSMADPTSSEDNYYAAMTVLAEVSAKNLDYIIQDKLGLEFYIMQDVYLDLRQFFTPEELAQMEDKLIYAQEEGSEDRWVAAVDITDLPYIQDNLNSEGPVYFSVGGSTQKMETVRDMWKHILAWESE